MIRRMIRFQTLAHLRFCSARWPAAQTPTANQLPPHDDSRLGRPLIQDVRMAAVPVSIGDFTPSRPAGFLTGTSAFGALIGTRFDGSLGLRPLAPLPARACPNQSNFRDRLGSAPPFIPSSCVPVVRLRAERIGGIISPIGSWSHPSPVPDHRAGLPPTGESVHPHRPFSHSDKTDAPASKRRRTSISYLSRRGGQTGAHPFPCLNSWSSRRHPAPPHTLRSVSPCRSHREEIPSLEIDSRRPAFQNETPLAPGLFNLSQASGSLPLSLTSSIRPDSDVIGHSDFPGGKSLRDFCCAKTLVLRVSGTLRSSPKFFQSQTT